MKVLIKYCVSLKTCSKINSAAIKPQRHREKKKIIQRDKFLLRRKKNLKRIFYTKNQSCLPSVDSSMVCPK